MFSFPVPSLTVPVLVSFSVSTFTVPVLGSCLHFPFRFHFFCSVLRRQGRQGEARGGQVNVRERDDLPEERGKTDMSMPCLCHASPKAPCWPIDQCFFLNRRPRLYHRGSRAQACARAIFPMHHSSYLAKITVWNRVEVRLIQRLARWAATRVSALDRKSKHLQVR